jgi:hypothetical protein
MGVTDFIAGASIRFLPGFNALEGSQVHGYITINNNFCNGSISHSIIEAQPEEKSRQISEPEASFNQQEFNKTGNREKEKVELYPNPNNGHFNIRLINFKEISIVRVYNLAGAVYFESTLEQNCLHKLNLPNLLKGVYFVRVSNGRKEFVKKMIVN